MACSALQLLAGRGCLRAAGSRSVFHPCSFLVPPPVFRVLFSVAFLLLWSDSAMLCVGVLDGF